MASLGNIAASLQKALLMGGRLSSADESVWLHRDLPNNEWVVRRAERGLSQGRVHYRGKNLEAALEQYCTLIAEIRP